MRSLLPYYHPTNVVFIDDDIYILQDLIMLLGLQKKPYQVFDDPREGLVYMDADTYRQSFMRRLTHVVDDQIGFSRDVFIKELMNPQRYHQVSVLIIDYEMPGMRGLEVCQAMKNPFVKKILLTGVADESIAIEAFNKGLIHQFVCKQSPHLVEHLKQAIDTATEEYFMEIGKIVLKILSDFSQIPTALREPGFQAYFDHLLSTQAIEEYYLVEQTGSFMMIDTNQEAYGLLTLTDDLVDVYLETDAAASLSAIQREKINQRALIPCYYDPFTKPHCSIESLANFLYEPTVIKGQNELFYCIFGQGFMPIDTTKVSFFNPSPAV